MMSILKSYYGILQMNQQFKIPNIPQQRMRKPTLWLIKDKWSSHAWGEGFVRPQRWKFCSKAQLGKMFLIFNLSFYFHHKFSLE